MITNVWLKSQPNKKISYPNCFINIEFWNAFVRILNSTNMIDNEYAIEATYSLGIISRIEFRP